MLPSDDYTMTLTSSEYCALVRVAIEASRAVHFLPPGVIQDALCVSLERISAGSGPVADGWREMTRKDAWRAPVVTITVSA